MARQLIWDGQSPARRLCAGSLERRRHPPLYLSTPGQFFFWGRRATVIAASGALAQHPGVAQLAGACDSCWPHSTNIWLLSGCTGGTRQNEA